jgi:hypothetical protein
MGRLRYPCQGTEQKDSPQSRISLTVEVGSLTITVGEGDALKVGSFVGTLNSVGFVVGIDVVFVVGKTTEGLGTISNSTVVHPISKKAAKRMMRMDNWI